MLAVEERRQHRHLPHNGHRRVDARGQGRVVKLDKVIANVWDGSVPEKRLVGDILESGLAKTRSNQPSLQSDERNAQDFLAVKNPARMYVQRLSSRGLLT